MNKIIAYNTSGSSYYYEHVNNFNNANNTTEYTDDVTHEKFIGTTLMVDMGVGDVDDQFGYHNTSSSNYYYDYIILEIDGSYYVGFDIVGYHPVGQDANANMDVYRDWVFNDWIVKISPAEYNMNGAVRIIAEDLGSDVSDFDYNDVVFDVKIANEWIGDLNANKLVAYIVLRAAGGTLPLTVAGKEVHNMFGVNTNVMVNTGDGVDKSPVSFMTILGDADYSYYEGNTTRGAEIVKDMVSVIVNKGNETIELATETGEAPEKICVPTTFRWCKEHKENSIYLGYPEFTRWVEDKSYTSWTEYFVDRHLY
jgi:ligand-binding SRPBCC domain-containing protein